MLGRYSDTVSPESHSGADAEVTEHSTPCPGLAQSQHDPLLWTLASSDQHDPLYLPFRSPVAAYLVVPVILAETSE